MKKIIPFASIALIVAGALLSPVSSLAESTSLVTCRAVPFLLKTMLHHHVMMRELDPVLEDRTAGMFIERMDPSRNLFLKKEVAETKKELVKLFDELPKGNCTTLDNINKKIIERTKENEEFVKKLVGKSGFKLDESVELMIDPEKRDFQQTEKERMEVLTKLIHFQLSNFLDTGTKLEEARKNLIHRYELITKRTTEVTSADLMTNFIDSFATSLDPHSSYLSPEVLEDFQISMSLSLEGIGVSLSSRDGYTVVEEIIPGGAADRNKALQPKDKIIAVAQAGEEPINIIDMALRDVVRLIRGKKGTKVTLTVLRQAAKTERIVKTIIRDKIDLKEQAAKVTYENREVDGKKMKLAVLDLPSFYGEKSPGSRSAYRDVKNLLAEIQTKKVDGLVLDLSRNGGGLLHDAVRISGLFMKKGPVVATKDHRGQVEVLRDLDDKTQYSGPMVVLTSRLSASASEIVAGALKDYNRAVIIGDGHTFGKGSVQQVIPLGEGLGALKITSGMFFRPGGNSTQNTGVISDVTVPTRYGTDDLGEKALDYSLPMQTIADFKGDQISEASGATRWNPVPTNILEKLAAKSKARVEKDAEFQKIKKQLDEAKKNAGIVKLASVHKDQKDKAKEDEDEEGKPWRDRIKNADLPVYKEALNILADYVSMLDPKPKKVAQNSK